MNKRGMIPLKELVHYIPYFMLCLVGLFILFSLWGVIWQKYMSAAQYDLVRVNNNLVDLTRGSSINVFTRGKEYAVVLYPINNKEPLCNNNACICVQESVQDRLSTTKCETIPNVDCTKARTDERFVCVGGEKTIQIQNTQSLIKEYVKVSKTSDGELTISQVTV